MIEVGNDLLVGEIIWSILPAQGGLPRAGSQGDVQLAFKYLPGQRCHNLSGQLLPVLSYPHSKNVFFGVWFLHTLELEASSSNVCPLPLVMSLGATENLFHLLHTLFSGT